jgi:hypothetical protein
VQIKTTVFLDAQELGTACFIPKNPFVPKEREGNQHPSFQAIYPFYLLLDRQWQGRGLPQ